MENIGRFLGANVYCDYAHHPKEISATLSVFDKSDTLVIFQPHTYSRTAFLMDDFVFALKDCRHLVIYKTYSAREDFIIEGSAKTLKDKIGEKSIYPVKYAETPKELKEIIKKDN